MQPHFETQVTTEGPATVVTLAGELDLASSAALEEVLGKAAAAENLIVDLRQVEFIDSTGLSVLVKAHQAAQEQGRRFGLVQGGAQVQRLLTLTGLTERLRVVEHPRDLLDGH